MFNENSPRSHDPHSDPAARREDDGIFYKEDRSAIFIDGANLYGAARSLGFEIDYKKLLKWGASKGRLVRAFYYTALIEDQEYSPIRPLVDWLDYNGYTMVTKPTKEFTDATGRRKIKGNMDIELAVDVMEMADHVNHIILFSGDGDFRRLVESVQRKGVRVTVVSTVRSQPPMVADGLRRQADHFLELQSLAPFIARKHQIDHQMHDIAWRAVLTWILVQRFVELADELLEDSAHRGVVDLVGMQIHILEALKHLEQQTCLIQFADRVVEVEFLQHFAHVRAEAGNIVTQVGS